MLVACQSTGHSIWLETRAEEAGPSRAEYGYSSANCSIHWITANTHPTNAGTSDDWSKWVSYWLLVWPWGQWRQLPFSREFRCDLMLIPWHGPWIGASTLTGCHVWQTDISTGLKWWAGVSMYFYFNNMDMFLTYVCLSLINKVG